MSLFGSHTYNYIPCQPSFSATKPTFPHFLSWNPGVRFCSFLANKIDGKKHAVLKIDVLRDTCCCNVKCRKRQQQLSIARLCQKRIVQLTGNNVFLFLPQYLIHLQLKIQCIKSTHKNNCIPYYFLQYQNVKLNQQ